MMPLPPFHALRPGVFIEILSDGRIVKLTLVSFRASGHIEQRGSDAQSFMGGGRQKRALYLCGTIAAHVISGQRGAVSTSAGNQNGVFEHLYDDEDNGFSVVGFDMNIEGTGYWQ